MSKVKDKKRKGRKRSLKKESWKEIEEEIN